MCTTSMAKSRSGNVAELYDATANLALAHDCALFPAVQMDSVLGEKLGISNRSCILEGLASLLPKGRDHF